MDAQHDISQWRNQDQNSNLSFHEIELVQALILAAKKGSCASRAKGVPRATVFRCHAGGACVPQ